ncbi:ABC transporter permease [Paraburkholderia phymatum]|uniref:ABC transporter permease n=1 Tax=Paraburkholderia phymatum TaxID=148447 RepID=A0ACC6UC36_9BURK
MSSLNASPTNQTMLNRYSPKGLKRGGSDRYPLPLAVLLLLPLFALLVFSFLYPVGHMLVGSVFDPDFTVRNYSLIFTEPIYLKILLRTLRIALLTTVGALFFGYPVALAMARAGSKASILIMACVLIPLWTSLLVRSYAWIILLQRTGVVNETLLKLGIIGKPLSLIYNEGAVIVAMVHVLLPFMTLPIFNALKTIPSELPQAAANLGAGKLVTFFKVILPLSMNGVYSGTLVTFILALGFYVTPALVGGPRTLMMSTLIAQQTTVMLNWPLAGALAMVLLTITLTIALVFRKILAPTGRIKNV